MYKELLYIHFVFLIHSKKFPKKECDAKCLHTFNKCQVIKYSKFSNGRCPGSVCRV